jgi:hypothetical protein
VVSIHKQNPNRAQKTGYTSKAKRCNRCTLSCSPINPTQCLNSVTQTRAMPRRPQHLTHRTSSRTGGCARSQTARVSGCRRRWRGSCCRCRCRRCAGTARGRGTPPGARSMPAGTPTRCACSGRTGSTACGARATQQVSPASRSTEPLRGASDHKCAWTKEPRTCTGPRQG